MTKTVIVAWLTVNRKCVPTSCRAGALLLTGLFFYDIFWVFGTPVMVSVAKSLDAPIKLLFPRPDAAAGKHASTTPAHPFVMPRTYRHWYMLEQTICG